jgi:hypothetical protein
MEDLFSDFLDHEGRLDNKWAVSVHFRHLILVQELSIA